MRVELLTGGAGVPCPQFLAVFLLLAALLLWTLKVDTVEHLVREGNDSMSDRSVSHSGDAPSWDAVLSSSGGLPRGSQKRAFPLPCPWCRHQAATGRL